MAKCSICGKEIKGFGCNPAPLKGEMCCEECDKNIVLPLRLYLAGMNQNEMLLINNDVLTYIEVEKEAKLEELQFLVDGYIEMYPKENKFFYFIVDEEGLLKKREYNQTAKDLLDIDAVGPVVVCPKKLLK